MANSQEPAGDGNSTEKAKLAWVNNAIVAGVVSAVIAEAISLTAVSSKITTTPYKRKPPRRYKPPGSWKQQRRPCSRPRTASMTTQTKCPEGVAWLQCSEHAAGYPTYVVDAANLQAVATVVADGTAGNLATKLASAVRATIHSSTATVEFSRWPSMANAYEALIQRCAVLLSEKH